MLTILPGIHSDPGRAGCTTRPGRESGWIPAIHGLPWHPRTSRRYRRAVDTYLIYDGTDQVGIVD
jgi:hypothetical protein